MPTDRPRVNAQGTLGIVMRAIDDRTEVEARAVTSTERRTTMSLYQRGKSWYYDFKYRSERYTGCIGPVSKTVAKEIAAKKKAEVVEGRYELPSKKPSPPFEEMADEYLRYYRVNRATKICAAA
jgi:hypothetical protein